MQTAMASSERIFKLLDDQTTIADPVSPVSMDKIKGSIEFKNVWFAYDGEEWVLKNVSFVINPGEAVAFVGHTGAGKTTIINLICRFYEFQRGEILIDGIDIRSIRKEDLRRQMAIVLQDVFLFSGEYKIEHLARERQYLDGPHKGLDACGGGPAGS
jgi:ABC-type multidrug transport system, ATPase and permease components